MSSNDSMSSSRLSQFGLYRTIDARTEEFLKLSRRRQIRQGCACAAISSAVTVTIVVSALFLYGYGVGSPPPAPRTPTWLDLMNDTDPVLFGDKLKNTIQLDRAAMKLLPIFFDKILEHDSSSPKYETKSSTEYNFEKDVFSGTNILSKVPSSRLFAIQYKTYPIVYIHSPRNTDNYLKLRKTREYERIMSYVDKMINERVNFASSRFVRDKSPITSQTLIETVITTPLPYKSSPITKKPKTINRNPKNHTYIQTVPNVKLNHTKMNDNKNNCKCTLKFGILIDKLIKCLQKVSQEVTEQPCSNAKEQKLEKHCIHCINRTMTQKTLTNKSIRVMTTTTPRPNKEIITSTESPKGKFNIPDSLLLNLFSFNHSKLKTKEFITQLPSIYFLTNNNNTTKKLNIRPNKLLSKLNILGKPNLRNLTFVDLQNEYEDEKYTTIATSSTSSEPTTTKYTTPAAGKYEDIFQEILFPEGNVFELTTYPQKSLKKDSVHFSSPHFSVNHYEISTEKQNSRKPIVPKIKQYDNARVKNISNQVNIIRPYTPKYPKIFPEEIVFEMFRKKNNKLLKEMKSKEPITIKDNKRLKDSNKNMISKLKDLLSTKKMHPQGKNLYKSSSPETKNNKPLSKFNYDMQLNLQTPSTYDRITEANLQELHVPQTTSTTTTTTTTETIPSSTFISLLTSNTPIFEVTSVPTQLQKYSHDQPILEITTPTEGQEKKPVTVFPKLERRNILNTEDTWNEFEVERTPPNENLEKGIGEITPTNNNITEFFTTTDQMGNLMKMEFEYNVSDNVANISQFTTINDENITWEGTQTADNQMTYKSIIPVGRKSYLEISRGDWKQSEPHINIDNVYDAFDELEE